MSSYLWYKIRRNSALVRFFIFSLTVILLKYYSICESTCLAFFASFVIYLITGGFRYFMVIVRTLPRDLVALKRYVKLQYYVKRMNFLNLTIPKIFKKIVTKHPHKACFLFEDEVWTFQQVEDYSNQVANYFLSQGYKPGDVVALLMESKPEYVCIWIGLSKIGCVTALINYNLRKEPLMHCIKESNCRSVIISADFINDLKDTEPLFKKIKLDYYLHGSPKSAITSLFNLTGLDELIKVQSAASPVIDDVLKVTDKFLYIYTSGTTGMPKPAIINHMRFAFLPCGVSFMLNMEDDDIIYDPLPLYHTAGGMIGIGQAVFFGRTVAIRKKFSASKFWEDCIKYNATTAQYIGEICRYLLNQPVRPIDRSHKVVKMFGNGLRPQIWKQFVERFNIKNLGEFYGATEGNANIININNKQGAVGFLTRLLPFIYPVTLIKINKETGEPIRDTFGMCMPCQPGESGEFVGKITKSASRRFDGYNNLTETEKKIVKGVFQKDDTCFRSGDLLSADELGYLYFKDRMGDTFRWRGENVSTAEVEAVLSSIFGDRDCVVFGVEIPGTEGKAGMACVVDPDKRLDVPSLSDQICTSLPPYACPLFVRILDVVDSTGTYKLKKVALKNEGYKLDSCACIYFLQGKKYVSLDEGLLSDIFLGKARI